MSVSSIGATGTLGGTYGLSGSGIDVDSLVKKLMAGQQAKDDALVQKQTILQWQKAAYNTVSDDLTNFRTAIFNYKLQATLSPNKVSSSSSSVATATANGDAVDVNHSLTVTQLADGVKLTSTGTITAANAPKDTIANQFYGGSSGAPSGPIQVTISNGTLNSTLTVSSSGSINDFVSQINNAGINVKANYDSTLDRFFLYSTDTGSSTGISFDGSNAAGMDFVLNKLQVPGLAPISGASTSSSSIGTVDPTLSLSSQFSAAGLPANFTLKLTNPNANGGAVQTVVVNPATNSLNDLMGAINASGTATASFTSGKFTITPTNGGTLDFSGSDSSSLAFLSGPLKLSVSNHNGKDAIINLDGANGLTQSSNDFTISGVAYALAGVSTGGPPATPTTISVTSDIDTAVASVQSFVDSYNKILAEVNGKINEPRNTDYPPLTNTQKAAMKDSDIVAWNAKSQSGMLHSDNTLTSLVNTMRNAVSNPVSGITGTVVSGTTVTYNSAASIGITTGDYTEGGKLHLNTDTLRAALQANPNVLNQLFGASGSTTVNGVTTMNTASEGIAGRLYDGIINTTKQLTQIAGTTINAQYDTSSNLAQQITAYTTQITDATATFSTMQSHYYTQYNAMEVALQQLSSQSSWLTSQLGTTTTG